MTKERDTAILAVRIQKDLLAQLNRHWRSTRMKSRNAWINRAIKEGLRPHIKKTENEKLIKEAN